MTFALGGAMTFLHVADGFIEQRVVGAMTTRETFSSIKSDGPVALVSRMA